jgi:type IV pilus assembly protein PilY1
MHTTSPSIPSDLAIKTGLGTSFARLTEYPSLRWLRQRWVPWTIVPAVAVVSFLAIGGASAPVIPAIALSADPLYATVAGDKPALALALSVEFPTVGAQYVDVPNTTTDSSYTNTKEYLGYYDAEACYTYNNAPTETPVAPLTSTDYKRFVRSGKAIALATPNVAQPTWTTRMCWNGTTSYTKDDGTTPAANDAFSGNYLNWASSSAIDMLRLSLTGGDRYVDETSLTILQRAVIPDGNPIHMWNSTNFPGKQLLRSGGGAAGAVAYYGAVPNSMATTATAAAADIWVVNTLNRIYFGTAKVGSNSGSASSYTLGGAGAAIQKGTQSGILNTPLPVGAVLLGGENVTYNFSGTKEVWFGVKHSGVDYWTVLPASGGIDCYWHGGGGPYGGINDPKGGVAKQCYVVPYTGAWTPTVTPGALNSEGYFFARAEVCNTGGSPVTLKDSRDFNGREMCTKYPNGSYKPTGAIQKYGDQLRLSAFGYLMDQTVPASGGRYGGVLRAPMKYVGGKTFDIAGVDNTPSGGNPNKEWNESTGIFIVNPESDATYGKSGVTTYLNQFGRTGPTPGLYKKYDPVGELHYEVLRYLQGLQPTPAAVVTPITAAMYDGFPAYTTWTDPYGGGRSNTDNYACLKSNIVVIGDINTWDGNHLPTPDAANNVPDINAWRTVVQNFEKNIASTYVDGQGVNQTTGNPNGANNSVPSSSDRSQIMGSAYWAQTHDIRGTAWTGSVAQQRPGLRVKTFIFDVNEYGQQNNATTRRTANQFFMAAKYGGFEVDANNLSVNPVTGGTPANNPWNTWGNPFKHDDGTVNKYVWEDGDPSATRMGEANTYFLQSDARGVLKAFDDIFRRASTQASSIAGAAAQAKNITTSGNTVYQGTFDTSDWSGDLVATPITVSSNVVSVGTTPVWKADAVLTGMSTPAASRKIFVGNAGATQNPVAAPFTWAAIESSLATALDKATPASASDGLAQSRLNYLRGDRSLEGTTFRARTHLLGDIVNSGVTYSGAPSTAITGSSTYATFVSNNSSRTPAVFVGANDGMLHAFNANDGSELFAYIPSWLGPKLPALTSPTYVTSHKSFMDGTPVVAEAEVLVSSTLTWKTVLVAGTGGGGQGVFALDVTNPATFAEGNVMWEFTNADDQDMGYVIGKPQILKMRTSAHGAAATYKWFAVVASGVNNYTTAVSGNYGSGYPALFLLDLSKPPGTAWTATGSTPNYYKISLPVNGNLNNLTSGILTATRATGLINFTAVPDINRAVKQIYAGDLHGQIWKLDFSLLGSTDWNIGKLSTFNKGTAATPEPYPLYTAKDSSGNTQPISMAPLIAYGPLVDTRYVLFGTGKYLETSDKTSTTQQTFYMVYDDAGTSGDTVISPAVRESAVSSRLRLKQGTASSTAVTVPAFTLGRAVTDVNSETLRSGWYFDFPAARERSNFNAKVVGDDVLFSSLIPGVAGATGSCSATPGSGADYILNMRGGNGTRTASLSLVGEDLMMTITGATTLSHSDNAGVRIKRTTKQVLKTTTTGITKSVTTTETERAGRLSWRQINNFQDLKNN